MSTDALVERPSGAALSRDADLLIASYLPSPGSFPPAYSPSNENGLVPQHTEQAHGPLPICVPQIAAGWDTPFARGHPVEDSPQYPTPDEMIKFIDGLNLAMVASPPLKVVDLVGKILGVVPYHWAMIAGIAMQAAAQTGMRVLAKTLTDRYLRAANAHLFHPRGLSIRICTTAAMQALLAVGGAGGASPKPSSKLDKFGRGVGSIAMRIPHPLPKMIVRAIADKPPKIPSATASTDPKLWRTERRLALVAGLAAPLTLDVPPPETPAGVLDKMGSWSIRLKRWQQGRAEQALDGKRREMEEKRRVKEMEQAQGVARPPLSMSPLGALSDLHKKRREMKSLTSKPTEMKVKEADLREHWKVDKLLWIVIIPQDRDAQIQDVATADSLADTEEVTAEQWNQEIERERNMKRQDADFQREVDLDEQEYFPEDPTHSGTYFQEGSSQQAGFYPPPPGSPQYQAGPSEKTGHRGGERT